MLRSDFVADWIAGSDFSHWVRQPLAGDASSRRYERLIHNDTSVILMDAPPDICGSQAPFVKIAKHLNDLGLSSPDVLAWDDAAGMMILEDLGGTDFAQHLATRTLDELTLYQAAVSAIDAIQSAPPPEGLVLMTPEVGTQMIDLAFEWAATDQSTDLAEDITSKMQTLLRQIDSATPALSLRDFHAENLIWRPEKTGVARVGLLDFQDAFAAHPIYDLVSLLRDARRDVDPTLLIHFIPNPDDRAAFHIVALQRNLRILGIFNRLAKRDGKAGYIALLPRVWGHIQTDMAARETRHLAPLIERAFLPQKDARS